MPYNFKRRGNGPEILNLLKRHPAAPAALQYPVVSVGFPDGSFLRNSTAAGGNPPVPAASEAVHVPSFGCSPLAVLDFPRSANFFRMKKFLAFLKGIL